MDKLIQLCLRSIIREVNGEKDISKQYEQLAMEEYKEHEDTIKIIYGEKKRREHKGKKHREKYISRVEDHIPKQTKKRLYEMVS